MSLLKTVLAVAKQYAGRFDAVTSLFPHVYGYRECSDPAYLKEKLAEARQELADSRRLASETQTRFRRAEEMAMSFMRSGTLETWQAMQLERDKLRADLKTAHRAQSIEKTLNASTVELMNERDGYKQAAEARLAKLGDNMVEAAKLRGRVDELETFDRGLRYDQSDVDAITDECSRSLKARQTEIEALRAERDRLHALAYPVDAPAASYRANGVLTVPRSSYDELKSAHDAISARLSELEAALLSDIDRDLGRST